MVYEIFSVKINIYTKPFLFLKYRINIYLLI